MPQVLSTFISYSLLTYFHSPKACANLIGHCSDQDFPPLANGVYFIVMIKKMGVSHAFDHRYFKESLEDLNF